MSTVAATAVNWTEAGLVPDSVIRRGIRRLLRSRLDDVGANAPSLAAERQAAFIEMMDRSPIALVPQLANDQHYEVPAAFFESVLGEHCKYSCGYWPENALTLSDAEEAALNLTCERADIRDGMQVLDLGCGWGSLALWVAERYPACHVTAVSNSSAQRDFIRARALSAGLDNVDVHVCDMNEFDTDDTFDRIVSIEMFEHMRNWRALLRRVSGWLSPDGAFLMHVFCHRSVPYEFVDRGAGDWMSRHFFSGGMMPSDSLPYCFQDELLLERQWRWSGRHYARTASAWLRRMDERKSSLMPILEQCYGHKDARKWWMRWRMFFMACEELFAFNDGHEWWVSHYPVRAQGRGRLREVRKKMTFVLNFAMFQIGWFLAVLSAARLVPLIGVAVIAAVVAVHLRLSWRPGRELALIATCAALGATFDSLLVAAGWVAYPSGQPVAFLAPYWIVAMWMSFATTLNVSLRWLRYRPLLAAAFGLAGGPLAYYTGEQLGGIILLEFTPAMIALGIGWGIMMPVLSTLSRRFDGVEPQAGDQPLMME